MLLTLSLVQKWLGSPFPEDVWAWWLLMHWLQLQSTPCEACVPWMQCKSLWINASPKCMNGNVTIVRSFSMLLFWYRLFHKKNKTAFGCLTHRSDNLFLIKRAIFGQNKCSLLFVLFYVLLWKTFSNIKWRIHTKKQWLQSEPQISLLSGKLNACQDSWLVEVARVFACIGV